MAIENEDFILMQEAREIFPTGTKCAILGDCHIHIGLDEFKKLLGFDIVETFDINGDPTHKVDLNEPLDESFHNQYDWIIDSGTLYCCFDVSTVLQNITNMLKDKGGVLHTGNLCGFYGRGFYSLSPALFRDFYKCNNFTIEIAATKKRQLRSWNKYNPLATYLRDHNLDFQESSGEFVPMIPNDSMIFCFAARTERSPFTKPVPQHFIDTDGK